MKEQAPLAWAGIDVGKGHHWICLIDEAGTTVWSTKVVNDAAAADAAAPSAEELAVGRELVRSARARGAALTGPDGLLKALTKTVLETALDEEMTDHLGYDKHDPLGRGTGTPATAPAPRRC
jgi:Transposase/Transposase, Mutator family